MDRNEPDSSGGGGTASRRNRAAAAAPSPPAASSAAVDDGLSAPELYLNRELSWLAFDARVLHQARDLRNPLLERLKFLAISASNLDEFFMKRIGGLKQQVRAGLLERTVDGRTPQEQIEECNAVVRTLEREQREILTGLLAELREHGIAILSYAEVTPEEEAALREYYIKNVFPLVTPLALDPAHPFPFISNQSLNLLITGHHPKDTDALMIRIKVPLGAGIGRFVRVGEGRRFVLLEDVMAQNLDLLLPDMAIGACELFRVTRNANTERDEEEADDLLAMIESELRDRRFAPIVRLEVVQGMDPQHRGMLAAEHDLDVQADVVSVDGMLALRDLMEIALLEDVALRDPPHHPIDHPRLQTTRSIFHVVREAGSLLFQHPYESFSTSVERFLREASEDPKVRAIKMTLYRTSRDSNVISYLREAAQNGKQVAAVVELKARFDEA
ncbi:MAG: polyphosphate kinase, partial [bacterium]